MNYLSEQCENDNYKKWQKIPKNVRLRFSWENFSSKQPSADSLERTLHLPNSHTHPPSKNSKHSKESNTISYQTIVSQNWCILSKDDEYVKFSIFSEVYDGSIFATSELKTELPELRKCWGLPWKFEKSMFFGPARLNIT